jgi:hypothetical protein
MQPSNIFHFSDETFVLPRAKHPGIISSVVLEYLGNCFVTLFILHSLSLKLSIVNQAISIGLYF